MLNAQVPLRWMLEPSVLLGTFLLTVVYLGAATRWRSRFPGAEPIPPGRIAAFLLAMATMLLALISPIAYLSDYYLFSAHMVEHMLLTLVVPPLLLIGVPGWMLRPLIVRFPLLLSIGRILVHPLVAYGLFNALFIGYHLPTFYDLSLEVPLLHALFHQIFIVTSILSWWPVLSPLRELPPLSPPAQMIYLFAYTLPTGLLGAFFTFAESPIYPQYANAPRVWSSLTPLVDQQLGGLIMWVIGGTFYLGAFALVFLRWAMAAESKERRRYRTGYSR
jgi:putative membrane protein